MTAKHSAAKTMTDSFFILDLPSGAQRHNTNANLKILFLAPQPVRPSSSMIGFTSAERSRTSMMLFRFRRFRRNPKSVGELEFRR
jgi:hypothetical protein